MPTLTAKKPILLLFSLILVPGVLAGTVTLEAGTELHATNLTFIINETTTFPDPVSISNDGYAMFGTQNFSVGQGTGHINITITSFSESTTQDNFWFHVLGQDEGIDIQITNSPATTDTTKVVEVDSSGNEIAVLAASYDGTSAFTFNATSAGKYLRVAYQPTGGGGSVITPPTLTTTTTVGYGTTTVPTTTINIQQEIKDAWEDIQKSVGDVIDDVFGGDGGGEPQKAGLVGNIGGFLKEWWWVMLIGVAIMLLLVVGYKYGFISKTKKLAW